jgi:hypothetical protein
MLKIKDKTYVTPCGLVDSTDFSDKSGVSNVEPDTEQLVSLQRRCCLSAYTASHRVCCLYRLPSENLKSHLPLPFDTALDPSFTSGVRFHNRPLVKT